MHINGACRLHFWLVSNPVKGTCDLLLREMPTDRLVHVADPSQPLGSHRSDKAVVQTERGHNKGQRKGQTTKEQQRLSRTTRQIAHPYAPEEGLVDAQPANDQEDTSRQCS